MKLQTSIRAGHMRLEVAHCPKCKEGTLNFDFEATRKLGFASDDLVHTCTHCKHEVTLKDQFPKSTVNVEPLRSILVLKESAMGLPPGTYPISADGAQGSPLIFRNSDGIDAIVIEYLEEEEDGSYVTETMKVEVIGPNSGYDDRNDFQHNGDSQYLWHEDIDIRNVSESQMLIPYMSKNSIFAYVRKYADMLIGTNLYVQ